MTCFDADGLTCTQAWYLIMFLYLNDNTLTTNACTALNIDKNPLLTNLK